ncbi:protein of unknown function DUF107 [Chloroherpeton thalassium ATCC 35110]|uniref:NfeD-like C-terminal domain-containing protein n=1 Tax=Chloroherpeton thalassium (strain ATCC 35110 / GB-78) TaxID=517418 RepID=B3QTS5_CHLT3|nr:NfeD family protein [Chloroherpeton thalassium]ACF14273.1 protein of unknown function DUF107 [Chloroherpeton thalassium ATCC 35110]
MESVLSISPAFIWFLVGVGFLAAEFGVPAFILLFFGAGAWIVSLLVLLLDIGLTAQVILFISSSLLLLSSLRKYSLKTFKGDVRNALDESFTDSKIGQIALVTKTIKPNFPGEVKVMGSYWRAVSDTTLMEGQSALVVNIESEDGLTLKVIPT